MQNYPPSSAQDIEMSAYIVVLDCLEQCLAQVYIVCVSLVVLLLVLSYKCLQQTMSKCCLRTYHDFAGDRSIDIIMAKISF